MSIGAGVVVVSCGAVNSAALLLRSANEHHPHGLANSVGTVGRQLHGAQQLDHGGRQPISAQPVGVPEDPLLQRLLPARHVRSPLSRSGTCSSSANCAGRDDQGAAPACADLAARVVDPAQHRLVAVHRRPARPRQQGHAATRRHDPDRMDPQQRARPRGVGARGAQNRSPPGLSARSSPSAPGSR